VFDICVARARAARSLPSLAEQLGTCGVCGRTALHVSKPSPATAQRGGFPPTSVVCEACRLGPYNAEAALDRGGDVRCIAAERRANRSRCRGPRGGVTRASRRLQALSSLPHPVATVLAEENGVETPAALASAMACEHCVAHGESVVSAARAEVRGGCMGKEQVC
jgi:hypothetical protein